MFIFENGWWGAPVMPPRAAGVVGGAGCRGKKRANLFHTPTLTRHPDLIYARLLSPTIKGLQNLLCGLGLPEVLEIQGKATMREALR